MRVGSSRQYYNIVTNDYNIIILIVLVVVVAAVAVVVVPRRRRYYGPTVTRFDRYDDGGGGVRCDNSIRIPAPTCDESILYRSAEGRMGWGRKSYIYKKQIIYIKKKTTGSAGNLIIIIIPCRSGTISS